MSVDIDEVMIRICLVLFGGAMAAGVAALAYYGTEWLLGR